MYQSLIELISDQGGGRTHRSWHKYQSLIELISDMGRAAPIKRTKLVSISYRVNF